MGNSKLLMEFILPYPSSKDIKWLLATRDMHALYKKCGFTEIANPDRFMSKMDGKVFNSPCRSAFCFATFCL